MKIEKSKVIITAKQEDYDLFKIVNFEDGLEIKTAIFDDTLSLTEKGKFKKLKRTAGVYSNKTVI